MRGALVWDLTFRNNLGDGVVSLSAGSDQR